VVNSGIWGTPKPGSALAIGATQQYELIGLNPTGGQTTAFDPFSITLGEVEIRGHVDLYPTNTSVESVLNVGMGIFVAEWDDGTMDWEKRSIFDLDDLDQPWLYYQTRTYFVPKIDLQSMIQECDFTGPILTARRKLHVGQSIQLIVQNGANSTTSTKFVTWLEAFVYKIG